MAYTETDLAAVRQAIMDLATGQRVTRCEINGRKTEFADTDLAKLQTLEKTIQGALQVTAKKRRSRTRIVTTSKGLW